MTVNICYGALLGGFLTISTDFERMLQYLTQQRSDLTIDKLRSLIDAKKQKIGAGYLTEQGALFLVAADLGISLDQQKSPSRIGDLYVGAKDVTL
jgi:hypothetical protein